VNSLDWEPLEQAKLTELQLYCKLAYYFLKKNLLEYLGMELWDQMLPLAMGLRA
jgi:hypothetical protein